MLAGTLFNSTKYTAKFSSTVLLLSPARLDWHESDTT